MNIEFAVRRTRSRGGYLTAPLFAELDRLAVRRVGRSSDSGWDTDIFHEPNPLPYRLGPRLFIGPANLGGPVRGVGEAFGFNADRKCAHHLARTDAVQPRPVVSLAVHHAGRARIAADWPLSLFLSQVFAFQIASQLSRR